MKKLNQLGFSHLIIPIAVVFTVGAIGAYVISKGHAATPKTATVTTYDYRLAYMPPTQPINDTLSFPTQAIKVIQITGTQRLNYTEIYPGTTSSKPALISSNSCYTVRAVNVAAWVKIVGYNGVSRNVEVKPYPTNDGYSHWQHACINAPAGASSTGNSYYIEHISGGPVNVYNLEATSVYAY